MINFWPMFILDKTLIVWKLTREENNYGVPQKRLYGHSHFVSDVVLSSDGHFALSGSWDKTLRLWDLSAGKSTRRFEDHTKVIMQAFFFAFFFILNEEETGLLAPTIGKLLQPSSRFIPTRMMSQTDRTNEYYDLNICYWIMFNISSSTWLRD